MTPQPRLLWHGSHSIKVTRHLCPQSKRTLQRDAVNCRNATMHASIHGLPRTSTLTSTVLWQTARPHADEWACAVDSGHPQLSCALFATYVGNPAVREPGQHETRRRTARACGTVNIRMNMMELYIAKLRKMTNEEVGVAEYSTRSRNPTGLVDAQVSPVIIGLGQVFEILHASQGASP